nr:hypothetical protein Q903MT_gene4446 [Picea sitchensis]
MHVALISIRKVNYAPCSCLSSCLFSGCPWVCLCLSRLHLCNRFLCLCFSRIVKKWERASSMYQKLERLAMYQKWELPGNINWCCFLLCCWINFWS